MCKAFGDSDSDFRRVKRYFPYRIRDRVERVYVHEREPSIYSRGPPEEPQPVDPMVLAIQEMARTVTASDSRATMGYGSDVDDGDFEYRRRRAY